jgi:prepilin-type processing-associated H-X9-DG protein
MTGYPDKSAQYGFFDLPGFYHNRANGFSYADGHSEIRKWMDARTMPAVVKGKYVVDGFKSPRNQDIGWLQERSSRPLK